MHTEPDHQEPDQREQAAQEPAAQGRRVLDLLGWGGRTDVQRVDQYTRGSLYVIFWFLLLTSLPGVLGEARTPWLGVVSLLLVTLSGVAGHAVLARVIDGYPLRSVPTSGWLLGFAAAMLSTLVWTVAVRQDGATASAYCVVMATSWVLGGIRRGWLPWALSFTGAALLGQASGETWTALAGAAVALFFVFTVQSTLWLLGVVQELDRARRTEASLAVAEERLRFARDVHDVLGRHLSVVAVQAELAAAMVERGDERAVDRIRQVRATAHDALREARDLARGYRELDLAQETEGAVALLTSAGARASADLSGLPPAWHEPVARVVREAVTNVLRHSAATRVEITYQPSGVVEVRNDRPRPGSSGDGSGLATLARDLAPLGARLTHGIEEPTERATGQRSDGDEFVLRLSWGDALTRTSGEEQ